MMRDVLARENAAVAMTYDDLTGEASARQIFRGQFIVFYALSDCLISSAHAFTAIISADRIVAAPIEGEMFVTERSDVRREKARGTDIEIHLIAVAIHRRAFTRSVRRVVSAVERIRRR